MLTLLVLPSVRASADRLVAPPAAMTAQAAPASVTIPYLPGARPLSYELSPVTGRSSHPATMPRAESRSTGTTPVSVGPSASEKEMPKPRRITREGCEAPLSSLVGPEARRMVPGRCMT